MSYNFVDDPAPSLPTIIGADGQVTLKEGTPQTDFLTTGFSGSKISVSIEPPTGWNLDQVNWTTGSPPFTVPSPGQVETHDFIYSVSQPGGPAQSAGGTFKIKKASGGGT